MLEAPKDNGLALPPLIHSPFRIQQQAAESPLVHKLVQQLSSALHHTEDPEARLLGEPRFELLLVGAWT